VFKGIFSPFIEKYTNETFQPQNICGKEADQENDPTTKMTLFFLESEGYINGLIESKCSAKSHRELLGSRSDA
jgi:hypothetical protein